jgi:hypothetical protein
MARMRARIRMIERGVGRAGKPRRTVGPAEGGGHDADRRLGARATRPGTTLRGLEAEGR